MDFVDLWRCGRIRCLHLIRIASCKTYSLQWFRVLGASFSRFWGLRFRSRVLRFRVLGASFSRFGCFVFEFWVLRFRVLGASFSRFRGLRFRVLGASCFGLRFRVLCFRNYLNLLQPTSNQIRVLMHHQYGISAFTFRCHFMGKPVVALQNVSCFPSLLLNTPLHV